MAKELGIEISFDMMRADFGKEIMEDDKTRIKNAMNFLKNTGNDSRILVVHNNDDMLFRSFRNLSFVDVKSIENLNVFDVFKAKNILFEEKSIEALNGRLS